MDLPGHAGRLMVKITGAKKHSDRLKRMARQEMKDDVYRALFAAGNLIETHAEQSITNGSVSGANHVPSAPGEPPNADTRLLDTSIETTGSKQKMKVFVTSNAPYSLALEQGTSKMAARPFMGPAVRAKRGEAVELVRQAVSRVARKGGSS